METKYFNTHAHCFTIDHVPENFFDELIGGKRFLRISKIKKSPLLQKVITAGTGSFPRWLVNLFSPNTAKKMRRLHGLIRYSLDKDQETVIKTLDGDYGSNYRLVLLTMDMDGMAAGAPSEDFITQLDKLKKVKSDTHYKDKIFPFVFADPRREDVTTIVKKYLTDKEAPFQGIKLYPALGYFPFDKNMKDIYQFAVDNDVPLITHCIIGDVYSRDENMWQTIQKHPISGQSTAPTKEFKEPPGFQYNFTHPLNYECLLNPVHAKKAFGEDVDFRKLKMCIGHFGGEDEWSMNTKQEKQKADKYQDVYKWDPLDIKQPWLGDANQRYNWLTIIQALLLNKEYPNVYADISFTLHDPTIYPLLKKMLQNKDINTRILFGTDYYVVATVSEESDLIKLRDANLTPEEIKLIAYDNPIRFLSSKINAIA